MDARGEMSPTTYSPSTAGVRPFIWARFDLLLTEIAKKHRVSRRDILSPARRRSIAWPRQELYARALDAKISSADVGRMIGRDHATVLFGAKRHRKRDAESAQVRP